MSTLILGDVNGDWQESATSVEPSIEPSAEPTMEPTQITKPIADVGGQASGPIAQIQADISNAAQANQWAVYTLVAITIVLVVVVASLCLYRRCCCSKTSKAGYTRTDAEDDDLDDEVTHESDDQEDVDAHDPERQAIGGGVHPREKCINFYAD